MCHEYMEGEEHSVDVMRFNAEGCLWRADMSREPFRAVEIVGGGRPRFVLPWKKPIMYSCMCSRINTDFRLPVCLRFFAKVDSPGL